MDERADSLFEDFDNLMELYEEYADAVDTDDIETRQVWDSLEMRISALSNRIARVRDGADVSKAELDNIELMMEDLDEAYGQLAELM